MEDLRNVFNSCLAELELFSFGFELETLPFLTQDITKIEELRRLHEWHVHIDNSVSDMGGKEFVSCPYHILSLQDMLAALQDLIPFVRITERAGLHVHVGVEYLFNKNGKEERLIPFVKNLIYFWKDNEEYFVDDVASRLLTRRQWCKKITYGDYFKRLENYLTDGNTLGRFSGTKDNRYRTLNLCSIFEHHTIEYRLFNGTNRLQDVLDAVAVAFGITHFIYCKTVYPDRFPKLSSREDNFSQYLLWQPMIGQVFGLHPDETEYRMQQRAEQVWG